MDYEKEYKEALKRAQNAADNGMVSQNFVSDIFPELAESEDERIRKELIRIVDIWTNSSPVVNGIPRETLLAYLEKQKEQKPVDKFQEYLNASPAERRKMNMDEILGDNKGHQKTSDALTTDSNKEADTSDCKYMNLDEIAQDYVDGVKEYNPEPTWDLMQTAVCYGYHFAENKQKPAEWSEEDECYLETVINELHANKCNAKEYEHKTYDKIIAWLKSLRPQPHWKPSEEQMSILGKVFAGCELNTSERDSMVDLFYHLKDMI